MRDAIIFLIIFGSIPFTLKRPMIGVLMFAWVSLMNPHRLTYGAAYEFPFAMILCAVALIGVVISKDAKKIPPTATVVVLGLFAAWMTLTGVSALEPALVWTEWTRVMKTLAMIMVTIMVVRTPADVKALTLVVGLSLGFWGLKGGLFTVLSGGTSHVLGPVGSYISDNNALALAMVTVLPLLAFFIPLARGRWQKLASIGLVLLTVASALGSYSRGALLGLGVMFGFLWLKSKTKVKTGLALGLLAPVIYMSMPDKWMGRMESIDNYQEDASAMGRINAWHFAVNVANENLIGGGYSVFTPRMFHVYAPDPQDFHAAHSIYFQVLGEHGYFGLLLYLTLFFCAWRCAARVIRFCKGKDELAWAGTLAAMCQVSIIGYMVGGAFLSLAYYDLIYYVLAIIVGLEKVLILAPQPQVQVPAAKTFLAKRRDRPASPETAA